MYILILIYTHGKFTQTHTQHMQASGIIGIEFGAQGPNFGVTSACAVGSHAIGEAMNTLRRGDADMMLAGTVVCMCGLSTWTDNHAYVTSHGCMRERGYMHLCTFNAYTMLPTFTMHAMLSIVIVVNNFYLHHS